MPCIAAVVAVGALSVASDTALAQRTTPRPIELGADAALRYGRSGEANVLHLDVPIPNFRVGFFVGEQLSLEPFGRIDYRRVEIDEDELFPGQDDSNSLMTYDLGLGALFHFSADRTRAQTYVRPFFGATGFNGDGEEDSANQISFGAGVGVKIPVAARLAWRLEANYTRLQEDEPFRGGNVFGASIGLSFFTR